MTIKRLTIARLGALCLLLSFSTAYADIIDEHLRVRTFIAPGQGVLLDLASQGNEQIDTGDQQLINGVYSGNGRASAENNGNILRSRAASYTTGSGTGLFSSTRMSAARRDVLEVTGTGAPPTVRFNFSVHATFIPSTTITGGFNPDVSQSSIAVGAFANIFNFPTLPLPPNGTHASVGSIGGAPITTTMSSGWDTGSFTQLDDSEWEFNGTFSLLSNLLTGPGFGDGLYFMSAALDTYANNKRTFAIVDSYNTLVLSSITLPDGSPLPTGPDLSYQFESGAPAEPDDDLDGIGNSEDNCVLVDNPGQVDTNGDGFGNLCDADIAGGVGGDGDCIVNYVDLVKLVDAFFSTPASPDWNPEADLDFDLVVNFVDLSIMINLFFLPPGPSGLPNACDLHRGPLPTSRF